jgi:hypothetical protein
VSASLEAKDGKIYKITGTSTDKPGWTDDATVWALGMNAELTMFDPLTIAADLIYGELDAEDAAGDVESNGWYGALAATYKMEMVTPTPVLHLLLRRLRRRRRQRSAPAAG